MSNTAASVSEDAVMTWITGRLQSLTDSYAMIAEALEADPCAPDAKKLRQAAEQLNHNGLHILDYGLLAASLGVTLD